jgi:D-alanyl-D-alanine dipeptidase
MPIIMPKNGKGVEIITNINIYKKRLILDSNQTMVSLQHFIPTILLDLRYSTINNFTHRRMYPASVSYSFLRMPAAKALKKAQAELTEKGLGLKIFDAYRPYSVTKKFWELIHDERYVANPAKGSGHNRGIAIDLTIVDLKTGNELDMGTGFDNFTDSAHHSFTSLPESILANRKLLKETMEKYGFQLFETEWWHYSWPNPENYSVLDLTFEKLKKATK